MLNIDIGGLDYFFTFDGEIPTKQLRLVLAWIEIHLEELMANWRLCQNGENPFAIESLK